MSVTSYNQSGSELLYCDSLHVYPEISGEIQCPTCNKVFGGCNPKYVYERHYRTVHLRIKAYTCNYCKKKFTQDSNRKRHSDVCTHPVLLPHHVQQPGYNDKYLHCFLTLAKY